jgi:putative transcription factor
MAGYPKGYRAPGHQQSDQDWTPVVLQKHAPSAAAKKSAGTINAAARAGNVEVTKKFVAGENKNGHGPIQNAAKLEEDTGDYKVQTVSHEFKTALQQARMAKKMTQKALADAINEKQSVVNDYESGKAVPNGAVIQKLNKALGAKLPKAKQPVKKNLDDN